MRYGAAVDWWSFGILIYEMLNLKTPFYDKNRKLMFHSIINQNPKVRMALSLSCVTRASLSMARGVAYIVHARLNGPLTIVVLVLFLVI